MILTSILVFAHISQISPEIISSQSWPNVMHDLTVKFHKNKLNETHPLNEGFILLPDQAKKIKTKSSVCNTSSATCPTIILITTTTTTTTKKPTTALADHSIGHLGRRLLNEPSYDTEHDSSPSKENVLDKEVEELSKHLFDSELMVDGSGETTESSTTTTTTTSTSTTAVFIEPVLSNKTQFIIEINCTNANDTFAQILQELEDALGTIQVSYNESDFQCDQFGRTNVSLEFTTDNDTAIVNNLFRQLWEIVDTVDGKLFSDQPCGKTTIDLVSNVTPCYLINQCSLCGTNPIRGVCLEGKNESSCTCLPNEIEPSNPYKGPLCRAVATPTLQSPSNPAQWTPIIVGVLGGLTGLIAAVTAFLWAMSVWGLPQLPKPSNLRMHRLWHLPRAQVPTEVAADNDQPYSEPNDSTARSTPTIDTTFFRDLDDNFPATPSGGNPPSDLDSIPSIYDPIHELDSIIDNEDVDMNFDEPSSEPDRDDETREFVNPNVRLPQSNLNSPPATGPFSFFNRIF